MHKHHCLETIQREQNEDSDDEIDMNLPTITGPAHGLVRMTIDSLASTSTLCLVISPPIQSTSELPTFDAFSISLTLPQDAHYLLNVIPTTNHEWQL
jgi:hypothetical protein